MKSTHVYSIAILSLALFPSLSSAQSLPRCTPESKGVSTIAVQNFLTAADQQVDSMHSFMLLRDGHVLAEAWWSPESADKPHILWSLSKSFTSTAVGLAVEDGKLSIDDFVLSFFPEKAPEKPSRNLAKMRVRDLLTMSTGHQTQPNLKEAHDWLGTFFAHEVPHRPGTHFQYNTPATFMQSAIVQRVTGQTVRDYLNERLFQPLGIETPTWDGSPEGISVGGYGLYLRTEDIAKFGQLYLQKGNWQGKQLVPSKWIDMATGKHMSNGSDPDSDWEQGYGFQFWRCRHNAYRGDGKDGQFCIVMPDQNAVVVMTAKSRNLGEQLDLVWQHLLPAFEDDTLPENPTAQRNLQSTIKNLKASR